MGPGFCPGVIIPWSERDLARKAIRYNKKTPENRYPSQRVTKSLASPIKLQLPNLLKLVLILLLRSLHAMPAEIRKRKRLPDFESSLLQLSENEVFSTGKSSGTDSVKPELKLDTHVHKMKFQIN